ncbi:MAG: hypothetical protein DI563_02060 [Variovorax paradoxus]|uniref:Uncharacterized protein n=1 Tax=Variovorax paradoxus TaxID=34073 RepID=A0A2W5QLX4_VARPD|nr:MAG: hypothetical protein DI563_02060 [Variovorax paradoxus]
MKQYETLNEALIDCVKAAGGSKQVGPKLWPEKAPDTAQRMLLDCLNEDRAAKLSPDQVMLVLRLSRAAGHHAGIGFILGDLGYSPTQPIEPRDEAAELQRQFMDVMSKAETLVQRMERAASRLNVRAIA